MSVAATAQGCHCLLKSLVSVFDHCAAAAAAQAPRAGMEISQQWRLCKLFYDQSLSVKQAAKAMHGKAMQASRFKAGWL